MDDKRSVRNRLLFAKRRLDNLSRIRGGDFGKVSDEERQQPLQEFFFHLVGAIEFLAQTINDDRQLIGDEEDVNPGLVCQKLASGDPVRSILSQLHTLTRNRPMPADPYSVEESHFRILLLRNRVCHHGRNPFHFRRGTKPIPVPCSLFLDPRDRQEKVGSYKPAMDELNLFWKLVSDKCDHVLSTY